jgi:hypothetical protein
LSSLTFTLSQTDWARVLAITTSLVTGLEGAGRSLYLELRDQNALPYYVAGFNVTQAASLTAFYTWAKSAPSAIPATIAANSRAATPFPDMLLAPNDTVRIGLEGASGTDALGVTVVRYRIGDHWLELQAREHVEQVLGL